MLKTVIAYFWTRFEPTREERINAARKLLEGTGHHRHENAKKKKAEPTEEKTETLFDHKPAVLREGRFSS